MVFAIRKEKLVVAIVRKKRDGDLEAYVAHTVCPDDFWHRNHLAARAYLRGVPYNMEEYKAAPMMAAALESKEELHFIIVETGIDGTPKAQARKEAVIRAMLSLGIRLPAQVDQDVNTRETVFRALATLENRDRP